MGRWQFSGSEANTQTGQERLCSTTHPISMKEPPSHCFSRRKHTHAPGPKQFFRSASLRGFVLNLLLVFFVFCIFISGRREDFVRNSACSYRIDSLKYAGSCRTRAFSRVVRAAKALVFLRFWL